MPLFPLKHEQNVKSFWQLAEVFAVFSSGGTGDVRRSNSQLSSPLVLWCLFGVPQPTFVPISKSKHPIYLAHSTVCLWSLPITLQCETTHSSINHLSVHTSCKSIHHRSIPSCYHQPLPGFPNSSPPGPLSIHSSKSQSPHPSIDPYRDIHLSSMNISIQPSILPSLHPPLAPHPSRKAFYSKT